MISNSNCDAHAFYVNNRNFGLNCLHAISVTLMEAVRPTHSASTSPLARHFHGMPAEGKRAHLPFSVCRPTSDPPGLPYCLFNAPKATGHLHVRGGAGESLCGQSQWHVSERVVARGERKRSADQRAAQSVCQLIDEEERRGEWEER